MPVPDVRGCWGAGKSACHNASRGSEAREGCVVHRRVIGLFMPSSSTNSVPAAREVSGARARIEPGSPRCGAAPIAAMISATSSRSWSVTLRMQRGPPPLLEPESPRCGEAPGRAPLTATAVRRQSAEGLARANLSRSVATEQPTSGPKRRKTVKLTSARKSVKTLHLSLGRTELCGRHNP